MKKLNNKGFSVVEGLLILVVIGIIGGAGYYVWNKNSKSEKSNEPSSSVSIKPSSDSFDKTFTSPLNNFSVMYPSEWKLSEGKTKSIDSGDASKASLTSPGGTVLHLDSNFGGYGGGCQPRKTDQPFKPGNACDSWEYISKELVPSIDNVYYSKEVRSQNADDIDVEYVKTDVNIVSIHYADTSGKSKYIVGLEANDPLQPELNKPFMGLALPWTSLTVYNAKGDFKPYIYAYSAGKSKNFLSSKDAKTVRSILRTFEVID